MINKKTNSILMAMDNGLSNMKIRCGKEPIIYFNGIEKGIQKDTAFLDGYTKNVVFNDEMFLVGNKAKSGVVTEGKNSDDAIIKALVGISLYCKPSTSKPIENKVFLMYGESVDKYFNVDEKTKLLSKLQNKHTIIVSGQTYNITIELVHLLPEGVGYIFSDLQNRSGVQYIVDMGGTTINFLTVVNGIIDEDKSESFTLGKHKLVNKLTQKIRRNTSITNASYELVSSYLDGTTKYDKIIANQIDIAINEHLAQFDTELSVLGFEINDLLKHTPVTFLGGTTSLLRDQILNRYRSSTRTANVLGSEDSLDSLFATVNGFYELGVALHSSKLGNE